jgi:hypothetical protein
MESGIVCKTARGKLPKILRGKHVMKKEKMLELGRTTTTSPSTSEEGILAAVALLAYG